MAPWDPETAALLVVAVRVIVDSGSVSLELVVVPVTMVTPLPLLLVTVVPLADMLVLMLPVTVLVQGGQQEGRVVEQGQGHSCGQLRRWSWCGCLLSAKTVAARRAMTAKRTAMNFIFLFV